MYEINQRKKLQAGSLFGGKKLCNKQVARPSVAIPSYYSLFSGEILKPQPLVNGNAFGVSTAAVHSNCDISTTSTCDTSKSSSFGSKPETSIINPKEFVNDDSSPFDNVELQTIDDIKELDNVFQAINNVGKESEQLQQPVIGQQPQLIAQQPNCSANISTATNSYPVMFYQPVAANFTSANLYKTPVSNIPVASSSHYPFNATNSAFMNSFPKYQPIYYPQQPQLYHTNSVSPLEMRRSSSEKKNLFESTAEPTLRSSRSVSDLTQIGKKPSDCEASESRHSNQLTDRSRTPPPPASSPSQSNHRAVRDVISLPDPYHSLSVSERQFVDNLAQMGFKRDRVSRAVKHIDIEDDKKLFEYLLSLQQLEDQGYDCYESEVALHMNNYNKQQVFLFLL